MKGTAVALFRKPSSDMAGVARLSQDFLAENGIATELRETDDPRNPGLHAANGNVYFLANVAAKCFEAPPRRWRAIIAQHFESIISDAGVVEPEELSQQALSAQIRTRLLHDEGGSDLVKLSYARPFSPGLFVALCVDYPTTVRTLNASTLKKLPIAVDELYRIGQSNVDAEPIDDVGDVGSGVVAIEGASLFTASKVLNMPKLISDHLGTAPHGVVFSVPHRNIILAVVPTKIDAVKAVNVLVQMTNRFAEGGFGPLPGGLVSSGVFFWFDGTFQQIAGLPGMDPLGVQATDGFLEMLNSLQ